MALKNYLKRVRRGVGGVFFIVCGLIGSMIMVVVTDLGQTSAVTAVSSNISHVVATKAAIFSYNNSMDSYETNSGTIVYKNKSYSPLKDFNDMASTYGFLKSGSSGAKIKWDNKKKVAEVDIDLFHANTNNTGILSQENMDMKDAIDPPTQTIKIEDK